MIISQHGQARIIGDTVEIYIDTCTILQALTEHIDIIKELVQVDDDLYQELINFNTAILDIK